jgi:hypothetical protein
MQSYWELSFVAHFILPIVQETNTAAMVRHMYTMVPLVTGIGGSTIAVL